MRGAQCSNGVGATWVVSPKFGLLVASKLPLGSRRHLPALTHIHVPGDRQATTHRRSWPVRAAPDCLQAPAAAPAALTIALAARCGAPATSPGRHPLPCGLQLLGPRIGSLVQSDERAPVHTEVVGLAGVAD